MHSVIIAPSAGMTPIILTFFQTNGKYSSHCVCCVNIIIPIFRGTGTYRTNSYFKYFMSFSNLVKKFFDFNLDVNNWWIRENSWQTKQNLGLHIWGDLVLNGAKGWHYARFLNARKSQSFDQKIPCCIHMSRLTGILECSETVNMIQIKMLGRNDKWLHLTSLYWSTIILKRTFIGYFQTFKFVGWLYNDDWKRISFFPKPAWGIAGVFNHFKKFCVRSTAKLCDESLSCIIILNLKLKGPDQFEIWWTWVYMAPLSL